MSHTPMLLRSPPDRQLTPQPSQGQLQKLPLQAGWDRGGSFWSHPSRHAHPACWGAWKQALNLGEIQHPGKAALRPPPRSQGPACPSPAAPLPPGLLAGKVGWDPSALTLWAPGAPSAAETEEHSCRWAGSGSPRGVRHCLLFPGNKGLGEGLGAHRGESLSLALGCPGCWAPEPGAQLRTYGSPMEAAWDVGGSLGGPDTTGTQGEGRVCGCPGGLANP